MLGKNRCRLLSIADKHAAQQKEKGNEQTKAEYTEAEYTEAKYTEAE